MNIWNRCQELTYAKFWIIARFIIKFTNINIVMNLDRYPFFTSDYQDYEFFSEGPKGRIKKVVKFMKAQDDPIIFNLAFGDEDP